MSGPPAPPAGAGPGRAAPGPAAAHGVAARPARPDVVVLGGGPAGRALAGECGARGLRTTLVDPAPDRPWRSTYGAWAGELPGSVPGSAIGSRSRARMIGTSEHVVDDAYVVLHTAGLRTHLDGRLDGVRLVTGRAVAVATAAVTLSGGEVLHAGVVVDATGAPSALRRTRPGPVAEQTAYGVVVAEELAAPLVRPGEAVFMDWRPEHGHAGPPTFLYAVPYGDGTVLLEETSLARRPGLPLAELRDRLHTRLRRHGVRVPGDAPTERVRFPVDEPRAPALPVAFGAAAPLVHPASGFSVATALGLAPAVAGALAAHLPRSPAGAGAAAARVLWPARARAVHRLRRHGLQTVLDLPPELVPAFFEAFFRLPERHRAAFLSGREHPVATLRAMGALARTASTPVRVRMLRSVATATPRHRPDG